MTDVTFNQNMTVARYCEVFARLVERQQSSVYGFVNNIFDSEPASEIQRRSRSFVPA